jgi:hypothetical protein
MAVPMPPISLAGILVPDAPVGLPEGFTRVDARMRGGLPHVIGLPGADRLLLIAPSGLAVTWRDAAPSTVVSDSLREIASGLGAGVESVRLPVRLLFQSNGRSVAVATLVAGGRQRLPEAGELAARIEVVVLEWTIHAGTIRGGGDFGSTISLGWRVADRAVDAFSDPPPNPVFVKRQPPAKRLESEVGRTKIDPRWLVIDARSRINRGPFR